jgi:hypothetical protein
MPSRAAYTRRRGADTQMIAMRRKKKAADEPIVTSVEGMPVDGPRVVARCPMCGHEAVFERFEEMKDLLYRGQVYGQRKCPNPNCKGHLFFVSKGKEGVTTFPVQRVDFEKDGIPEHIMAPLDEALECHANGCYTAAAMMTRRVLELVCDEKAASGERLLDRLKELTREIVLPDKLLKEIDILSVFGDERADARLSTFPLVGKEESEAGLALTKEILKAAYQYNRLIDRLSALKEK